MKHGVAIWSEESTAAEEGLLCTALYAVFNGSNLELLYNGIMHVFLHTKKFCRQIRQLLIITYSITGTTKSVGQEFSSLLLHLAKGPGPLTLVDRFCTGAFEKTSDFGFLHSIH